MMPLISTRVAAAPPLSVPSGQPGQQPLQPPNAQAPLTSGASAASPWDIYPRAPWSAPPHHSQSPFSLTSGGLDLPSLSDLSFEDNAREEVASPPPSSSAGSNTFPGKSLEASQLMQSQVQGQYQPQHHGGLPPPTSHPPSQAPSPPCLPQTHAEDRQQHTAGSSASSIHSAPPAPAPPIAQPIPLHGQNGSNTHLAPLAPPLPRDYGDGSVLYVLGLPHDFTSREAHLLFVLAPECLGCELYRQAGVDLYAAARFRSWQAAQTAQNLLEHRQDILGSNMRCEVRMVTPQNAAAAAQAAIKKSRFAFANDQDSGNVSPSNGSTPSSPLVTASVYHQQPRSIFGEWNPPPLTPRSPTSIRRLSSTGGAPSGSGSTLPTPITSPPPPTVNPQPKSQRVMPPANPADRNPPCNTLYVGNLPQDTSEDELRDLFCVRPGYKRLCFRTKQNGPMCFVEFENEVYAGQALEDLYGVGLSNSVKGGIRLSFSKNPLGVRSNKNPTRPQ